jgi:cytochrome c-type biogenesis protein
MLAAQRLELLQVAAIMLAFGSGASLPFISLGALSRVLAARRRGSLLALGRQGKTVLGAVAGLAGSLIVTGLDRPLESLLVNASPEWLT